MWRGVGSGCLLFGGPLLCPRGVLPHHPPKKKGHPSRGDPPTNPPEFSLWGGSRPEFISRLGAPGKASTNSPALRLVLRPYRTYLSELDSGRITLVFAVQVQVLEEAANAPIWEHNFVHSSGNFVKEISVRDSPVGLSIPSLPTIPPGAGKSRDLKEFKGEAGAKL